MNFKVLYSSVNLSGSMILARQHWKAKDEELVLKHFKDKNASNDWHIQMEITNMHT